MNREEAFALLIENDLTMLRKAVWRIMRNISDTDEVIQNALLKAWQKFTNFRKESKFSSWVYRIAINEAYNLQRQQQREIKNQNEILSTENSNQEVDENAEKKTENLKNLNLAICKLPDLYRQAIHLTIFEDFPSEKAAILAQCTVNTLYWRVHKAKEILKKSLLEMNNEKR